MITLANELHRRRAILKPYRSAFSRQDGVALVVSLIFLLMLTILGVTIMQTASLEGRMAANAQESNRTFEAAQSAIDRVLTEGSIFSTPTSLTYGGGSNPQSVSFSSTSPYADITVSVNAEWFHTTSQSRSDNLRQVNALGSYDNILFKLDGDAVAGLRQANAKTTQGYVQPSHAQNEKLP